LTIENQVFEVVATNGDTHLGITITFSFAPLSSLLLLFLMMCAGGEDFDQRVMEYLLKTWRKKTSIDATQDKKAIQR
jgi:endoplasmic reticulum chaperone BiP